MKKKYENLSPSLWVTDTIPTKLRGGNVTWRNKCLSLSLIPGKEGLRRNGDKAHLLVLGKGSNGKTLGSRFRGKNWRWTAAIALTFSPRRP